MWKKLTEFPYYQSGKPCWWLCRIGGKNGERLPLMISANMAVGPDGKIYKKEDVEWLDELESSFSLEDLKDCYTAAVVHTRNSMPDGVIDLKCAGKSKSNLFLKKHNIQL